MPNIFFFMDATIKLVLVAVFFILFAHQIYQLKDKPLETRFFAIALLTGSLGAVILLIDTVLWEFNSHEETRIIFQIFALMFLQLFACFLFLHYDSVIDVTIPRWRQSMFFSLVILNSVLAGLYFLESSFGVLSFLPDVWSFLGVSGNQGRIVIVISQITFLTWVPVLGLVLSIMLRNNLVELKKIDAIELIAIVIQFLAATFLVVGELFMTLEMEEESLDSPVIAAGIAVFSIGVIILFLNYLLLKPVHIQSPSIQHEHYQKLQVAFMEKKETLRSQIEEFTVVPVAELMPKKLPSTALFILIHILDSESSTSYAKSIEAELGLGKSTVSYNLNLLEHESLIKRKIQLLEDDHRLKAIEISTKGFEYLFNVYLKLDQHFTPSERMSTEFMKKYVEGLLDEAINVLIDTYSPAKTSNGEASAETRETAGISTLPTRKLSTGEIFALPHYMHPTALEMIRLLKGTVEEIAEASGLDVNRTRKNLNALREKGFLGVQLKGGKTTYIYRS
ncbi:MAG: hypothetical protein ACXAB4_11480 [Candidatus Hodarchaeales archaeon]